MRILTATFLAVGTAAHSYAEGRQGVEVLVRTIHPELQRGRLVALSLRDGAVLRRGADEVHLPLEDIIRITAADVSEARAASSGASDLPSDEWTVFLGSGDVLRGRVVDGFDETLVLDTRDLRRVSISLESVSRIVSPRARRAAYDESRRLFERAGPTDDDVVLLTNGDVLRGFVVGMDAESLLFDTGTGQTQVPLRLVLSARFAHALRQTPDTPYLVLSFKDGGRVTVVAFELEGGAAEARLLTGSRVSVEMDRVARVDLVGGRWEWLSEHAPISVESASMLALDWAYGVDRNVRGGPIVVAGERFRRGFGVHSRSALTFALKGRYTQFVTWFGMDDDSGPFADVSVLVLVDGQRRYQQSGVRLGTLTGPVRLDVTNAKRIELIVEFGENGDLQDRFDWVEPGLVRKK